MSKTLELDGTVITASERMVALLRARNSARVSRDRVKVCLEEAEESLKRLEQQMMDGWGNLRTAFDIAVCEEE